MKKTIISLILGLAITVAAFAQTDSIEVAPYSKVMNSATAVDYKGEVVTIECVYFKSGYPTGYVTPIFVKNKYCFQCVEMGATPDSNPLSGASTGDVFATSKDYARNGLPDLKSGDKVRITGTPKILRSALTGFMEANVVFMVDKVEKIL